MNKCGCNKIQQSGEVWMNNFLPTCLCNSCGSEIGACSWNCTLVQDILKAAEPGPISQGFICQNCKRDLVISEVLDLSEIVKNS